jgi:uridine monophosphate synthetase
VTGFFERLEERCRAAGSLLCVGLDPRTGSAGEARDSMLALIRATAGSAAAFKPNAAFFEALGPDGVEVLAEVIAAVPEEIPVILDAKRGDISSTAEAYARACFDVLGAGSVTLSPYLGRDAIDPFLAHEGRGVWVLCRTSNPSAAAVQDERLEAGHTVAEHVARLAAAWAGPDRLGLVGGATAPEALAAVRARAPEHWILAPGVGAQGGAVASAGAALRPDGLGVLVPVSRAVAEAPDPAAAAAELRDELRRLVPGGPGPGVAGLAAGLHDAGCVAFGEFTLRSGASSPVYVDLRRLSGHPSLLSRAAEAVGGIVRRLEADHLGAVPYGALPLATTAAVHTGTSLVWPRKEAKEHGTGARVEGDWRAGDRVVLVDDVVTSGGSVLEAAATLRGAGLVVDDVVALVDREQGAAAALGGVGLRLHPVTTLRGIVDDLVASGRMGSEQRRLVLDYLMQ